jgi:hypothetical protein
VRTAPRPRRQRPLRGPAARPPARRPAARSHARSHQRTENRPSFCPRRRGRPPLHRPRQRHCPGPAPLRPRVRPGLPGGR